jgi:ABC-type ATPase with predicted acetyltransferase domain
MTDSGTSDVVAVWPCDHGNVLVESGKAKPGYQCHECGAVAETYVKAQTLLGATTADRLLDELVEAAGDDRRFTSERVAVARWDMQAALRKVLGI